MLDSDFNSSIDTLRAQTDRLREKMRSLAPTDQAFQRQMDELKATTKRQRAAHDAHQAKLDAAFKESRLKMDQSFAEFNKIMGQ